MRHEIDIIASRENVVHFIEVKARSTLNFGLPEESVSNTKLESMMTAAEEYLWRNRRWTRVQYDIVAIVDIGSDQPKLMLIEDVYF
jgi:putative endonuclease